MHGSSARRRQHFVGAQAKVHAATKVTECHFFGPRPIKDNAIPDDVTAMGRNGLSKIEALVTASSDRRAQPLPSGSKSPPTRMPVEVVDPPERTLVPDATEVRRATSRAKSPRRTAHRARPEPMSFPQSIDRDADALDGFRHVAHH